MAEPMMDTRWKALFEAEPDAVLVVAGDGALREVNPAGLILFEAERAEEVVGRTLVAREEQQPEPDLRNEQRLREREQVRDGPAGARAPGVERGRRGEEAHPDHEECVHVVHR